MQENLLVILYKIFYTKSEYKSYKNEFENEKKILLKTNKLMK